jgi:alkylated DNA repair dioxygenase AlkB
MEENDARDTFRALSAIDSEVQWQEMHYFGKPVPRLVCVQGTSDVGSLSDDGSESAAPLYRHPVDEQPPVHAMSPTVQAIAEQVRKKFGCHFNHVLIQLYRSGDDSISQHSDKTLDVVPNTPIVNVSLGASRCFMIRSKTKLKAGTGAEFVERITLPHNSLLAFGLETNRLSTHQIAADDRAPDQRRIDERGLEFGGQRISLTFRAVGTFILPISGVVYGQGAKTFKTRKAALIACSAPTSAKAAEAPGPCESATEKNFREKQPADDAGSERLRLANAFRAENKQGEEFSWEETYGEGFDVVTPTTFL